MTSQLFFEKLENSQHDKKTTVNQGFSAHEHCGGTECAGLKARRFQKRQ